MLRYWVTSHVYLIKDSKLPSFYIPTIKAKISSFQWIAINIIKEDTELPMDAKIKGPLRPLLSDQTPRKQAVSIAGTVRATLNNKIYWEAFLLTVWAILQWDNLLRNSNSFLKKNICKYRCLIFKILDFS